MQFQPQVDSPAGRIDELFLAISLILFGKERLFIYPMKLNFVSISNFAVLNFYFNYFIHELPPKGVQIDNISMSLITQ